MSSPAAYTRDQLAALPTETVRFPGQGGSGRARRPDSGPRPSGGESHPGRRGNPEVTAPPSPGALVIQDGSRHAVLSSASLAHLPQETKTVTFESGAGTENHTETGPALDSVLRAAHLREGLSTWVAAVGSGGYVVTATPAESWVGGRPLLISLAEDGTALAAPRMVTDGDIKGGRYVSGTYDLVVGQGAPAS